MERLMTKLEFEEWRESPAARAIRAYLSKSQEALRSQWEMGSFQAESDRETTRANDAALAEMKVLKELSDLDYDKYSEVMSDDDEQVRPETPR